MIITKIDHCKNVLNSDIKCNDRFSAALYGLDEEEAYEQAEDRVSELTDILYPYLAEAMLRGITFTKELQELYGRTGTDSNNVNNINELPWLE